MKNKTINIGGVILGKETIDFFTHPEKYVGNRNITKDLLLANGWEIRCGLCGCEDYFIKHVCDNKFHFELTTLSNMVGRDWHLHVDNCDFQTIGGCAIQTTKHFNDFMKLLEIPYELH